MKPRCFLARRLFSPWLDDRLEQKERGFMEDHLAHCQACAERLRSLRGALDQARFLEVVEPGSGFEAEILAALPPVGHADDPARSGSSALAFRGERQGVRWLPHLGLATATAAALLVGFLVRDFLPFAPGPANVETLGTDGFASLTPTPVEVRGSVTDHLNRSQAAFLQLASLAGQAPRDELHIIQSELELSGLRPRTAALRRVVPAVEFDWKNDVLVYLDATKVLLDRVERTVRSRPVSGETVVLVRQEVLGSNILDTIDALQRSFADGPVWVTADGKQRPEGRWTRVAPDDDVNLFLEGKNRYYAGDFVGAAQCFEECNRRFPRSWLGRDASFWQGQSALQCGNVSEARGAFSFVGKATFRLDPLGRKLVQRNREMGALSFEVKSSSSDAGPSGCMLLTGEADCLDTNTFVIAMEVESNDFEQLVEVSASAPAAMGIRRMADYFPQLVEIRLGPDAKELVVIRRSAIAGKNGRFRKVAEKEGLDIVRLLETLSVHEQKDEKAQPDAGHPPEVNPDGGRPDDRR